MKKSQRGFFHISDTDLIVTAVVIALVGGFVVYVAVPWAWGLVRGPEIAAMEPQHVLGEIESCQRYPGDPIIVPHPDGGVLRVDCIVPDRQ